MIHYSPLGGNVACGRSGSSLNSSDDAAQVSCKLCLRTLEKGASEPVRKTPSLAELRAAAKAEKAAKVVAEAPTPAKTVENAAEAPTPAKTVENAAEATKPVKVATAAEMAKPAASLSSRAEWQKRLEQLPGRNRLPRGVARQAYI